MSPRLPKDHYLLGMALMATTRSEDPWRKVACVVADSSSRILATGYNGLLAGETLDDSEWADRDARLVHVVHAEVNALAKVREGEAETLACTLAPCLACAKFAAVKKVKRLVYLQEYDRDTEGLSYLKRRGVYCEKIDVKEVWPVAKSIVESSLGESVQE